MFEQAPTPDEAKAYGLTVDEATPSVRYWPDNEAALSLFARLATQWRTGVNGAIGLDYSAAAHVMDIEDIRRDQRSQMLDDLRVMEDEALAYLRRKAKKHG